PVAGMFRFMPLEGANSVLVITSQPAYLDQIEQWIARIDGAGGGVQLFSYELKYVTAKDLAERLSEVYGRRSGGGGGGSRGGASLMPGLESTEISDGGMDGGLSSASVGGRDGDGGSRGSGGGTLSLGERQGGNTSVTLDVDGSEVGVSAVDERNTLLVRSTGQAWRSIRGGIERLDVGPVRGHSEAQVVRVSLSGDLEYGVSWFRERGMADNGIGPFPAPGAGGPSLWSTLGATLGTAAKPGAVW